MGRDLECGCLGLGVLVMNDTEIQTCDTCKVFQTDEDAANAVTMILANMRAIRDLLHPAGEADAAWTPDTADEVDRLVLEATWVEES